MIEGEALNTQFCFSSLSQSVALLMAIYNSLKSYRDIIRLMGDPEMLKGSDLTIDDLELLAATNLPVAPYVETLLRNIESYEYESDKFE